MDLWNLLRILLRRWDVVLLGLVVTLVATLQVDSSMQPVYESFGTITLVAPKTALVGDERVPVNPLLMVGPSLAVTADSLIGILSSEAVRREAAQAGVSSTYEVSRNSEELAIEVIAESENPDIPAKTVDWVLKRLDTELIRIQDEVAAPTDQRITTQIIVPGQSAYQIGPKRMKTLAVVVAIGIIGTVTLGLVVDGSMRALSQRRRSRGPERDSSDSPPSPEPGTPVPESWGRRIRATSKDEADDALTMRRASDKWRH